MVPQVSAPGSPGAGLVLNRHAGSPSLSSLNAPTHPWIGTSLPAGPMITRSSKTTGGIVKVSPTAAFAAARSQRSRPVSASSASR